jgi:hypothetical protein
LLGYVAAPDEAEVLVKPGKGFERRGVPKERAGIGDATEVSEVRVYTLADHFLDWCIARA